MVEDKMRGAPADAVEAELLAELRSIRAERLAARTRFASVCYRLEELLKGGTDEARALLTEEVARQVQALAIPTALPPAPPPPMTLPPALRSPLTPASAVTAGVVDARLSLSSLQPPPDDRSFGARERSRSPSPSSSSKREASRILPGPRWWNPLESPSFDATSPPRPQDPGGVGPRALPSPAGVTAGHSGWSDGWIVASTPPVAEPLGSQDRPFHRTPARAGIGE